MVLRLSALRMLRSFLTLLALITGLAATGAQAETRLSGMEDIRLEAGFEQVSASQLPGLAEFAPLPLARKQPAFGTNSYPRQTVTSMVPTVMVGPDRARE